MIQSRLRGAAVIVLAFVLSGAAPGCITMMVGKYAYGQIQAARQRDEQKKQQQYAAQREQPPPPPSDSTQ